MTHDNSQRDAVEETPRHRSATTNDRPGTRQTRLDSTLKATLERATEAIGSRLTATTHPTDAQPTGRATGRDTTSLPWTVLLTNFESKWTTGWTSVEYYETDNDTTRSGFFFMLKADTGRAKVYGVKNHNGFIGAEKERHDWASGWTNVELYEVNGQRYLFLLKTGDGEVHIHEMNDDGTVGTYKYTHNWASGWTTVEFFERNGQQYLFLQQRETGDIHIHEMKDNGNVGALRHSYESSEYDAGVTHTEFYRVDGQLYCFMLRSESGKISIYQMSANGDIGRQQATDQDSPGISSVEFFTADGQSYIFLYKDRNGELSIHEVDDDGTIGAIAQSDTRKPGWSTATFYHPEVHRGYGCKSYQTKDAPYLSLLNEDTGAGHLYEMNRDGSIGARVNPPEPNPVSHYEELLTEAGAGMGLVADFWKTVSLGQLDLKGSEVYGWLTIQQSWEEVKAPGNDRWDKIQASITAAENSDNAPDTIPNGQVIAVQPEPPDSGAIGDNMLANPAGASASLTFYTHEMGHCLDDPEFPHSASNLDHDPPTYTDPWDVMSAMAVCRSTYDEDTAVGPKGPGLNAYYIALRDWFSSTNMVTIDPAAQRTRTETIKSLSTALANVEEQLVLRVNTREESDADYHYLVELRTPHGFDAGFEEPLSLLHRIVPDPIADDKSSRVLRRDTNNPPEDQQGWAGNPPFSYVFDDAERIGITTKRVEETGASEGGQADIYVGTKPGNVRLHRLDQSRVGGEIERHKWAEGWTSVEFYEVAGQLHLFLLKAGDGEVHIHEMNDDGTVGTYKYKHNWASGWTTVEFFESAGTTYLFLLKKGGSSGRIHIHEMKPNGNVGPMTFDIPISSGLTEAESYTVDGTPYLFVLNGRTAEAYNFELTDYGTLGTLVDAGQLSAANSAEFFEAGGDTYLFLLRDLPAGTARVYEVNDDGSVGRVVDKQSLPPGLSQVEFYDTSRGLNMFRLNESSGDLAIRPVNDDGSIGSTQHTRSWTSGWTSAAVYEANGGPHLFVLKESGI